MVASSISASSRSGRSSSSRRPAKPSVVIVARSVPEPFTHSTRTSRPVWSVVVSFAEVLPPPTFATARSAPRRLER